MQKNPKNPLKIQRIQKKYEKSTKNPKSPIKIQKSEKI